MEKQIKKQQLKEKMNLEHQKYVIAVMVN